MRRQNEEKLLSYQLIWARVPIYVVIFSVFFLILSRDWIEYVVSGYNEFGKYFPIIIMYIVNIFIILLFLRFYSKTWKLPLARPKNLPYLLMVISIGLVMIPFDLLLVFSLDFFELGEKLTIVQSSDTSDGTDEILSHVQNKNVVEIALTIILISIFVPIYEEIIFRGILLHRMIVKIGVLPAIFITSLIFGAFHAIALSSFVFSVIVCLIVLHSRSLFFPIIIHASHNFTLISLVYADAMYYNAYEQEIWFPDINNEQELVLAICICGIIVFPWFLWLWCIRKDVTPREWAAPLIAAAKSGKDAVFQKQLSPKSPPS